MTIEYSLTEQDYVTYQLYVASQSSLIKKRRMQTRIVVMLLYLGLGTFIVVQGRPPLGMLFFVFGVLWFFFYPMRDARRYEKHYRKSIREKLLGEEETVYRAQLQGDILYVKEDGVESSIELHKFSECVELPTVVLMRLKGGGESVVIPLKDASMAEEARKLARTVAAQADIPYTVRTDWRWK
jgi:hypothetical protein